MTRLFYCCCAPLLAMAVMLPFDGPHHEAPVIDYETSSSLSPFPSLAPRHNHDTYQPLYLPFAHPYHILAPYRGRDHDYSPSAVVRASLRCYRRCCCTGHPCIAAEEEVDDRDAPYPCRLSFGSVLRLPHHLRLP